MKEIEDILTDLATLREPQLVNLQHRAEKRGRVAAAEAEILINVRKLREANA